MCQALPGKIVEIEDESQLKMAKVSFSGILRQVSLGCVPDAKIGDYVIVHAGFAISLLDEAEATKTLQLWNREIQQNKPEKG